MKRTRIDESRERLLRAFDFAMGVYNQQESTKGDQWRDKKFWDHLQHIRHEIEEIHRSKNQTIRLHNCADLASLALILLAHEMNNANYFEQGELNDCTTNRTESRVTRPN